MPLRDEKEIQEAHDLLAAVVRKLVQVDMPPGQDRDMAIAAAALCWALGHDHSEPGEAFAVCLSVLREKVSERAQKLHLVTAKGG